MPVSDSTPRSHVRLAIADDHPGVLAALTQMFGRLADVTVVGLALDGEHAVRLCRLARPDVVLMDLSMPGMDGVEATRRLAREQPGVRVVVITSASDGRVEQALAAGAVGVVMKYEPNEAIVAAVRDAVDRTEREPAHRQPAGHLADVARGDPRGGAPES